MQTYGKFEGFPHSSALFGLSNIMTPVLNAMRLFEDIR